jgi:hypothetical protein
MLFPIHNSLFRVWASFLMKGPKAKVLLYTTGMNEYFTSVHIIPIYRTLNFLYFISLLYRQRDDYIRDSVIKY